MICANCPGAAHPASGSFHGRRADGSPIIVCGPCTRRFWDWFLREQQPAYFRLGPFREKQFARFYDHVRRPPSGPVFEADKVKRSALSCPKCYLGYADCKCPPTYADPKARARRLAEIQAIKEESLARVPSVVAAHEEHDTERVRATLSVDLHRLLERRARLENRSLSELVELLIAKYGPEKERESPYSGGERVQVGVTMLVRRAARLRLLAEREGVALGSILERWIDRGLRCERTHARDLSEELPALKHTGMPAPELDADDAPPDDPAD